MQDNASYHANRTHLSSSMLKMILKDIERFNREWNLGIVENEQKNVFDEGSLTHSLILEPHKVHTDYAFFSGMRKQGPLFETFKAENAGKVIISATQKLRTEQLFTAYQGRAEAVKMLQGGFAEHNVLGAMLDIPLKARADYINVDQGYIVDVKTTAYPAGYDVFKETIKTYMYDLSAALYCELARQQYGKPFDFYFIVLSKADLACDIYKASSQTLSLGTALTIQALVKYKRCKDSNIWSDISQKALHDTANYEILEV